MHIFFEFFKKDCRKLFCKRSYFLALLLTLVSYPFVFLLALSLFPSIVSEDLSLGYLILLYIPAIIFIATRELFSQSQKSGEIQASLSESNSRSALFFSKIFAIFLLAISQILLIFLAIILLALFLGAELTFSWIHLAAYLSDLIPLFILVLLAVLVNQITKNGVLAILLCTLIYAALWIFPLFVPWLSEALFTSYFFWHNLWLSALPFRVMAPKIGILLGYALIFGGAGFHLFSRRNS